jgi:hypothetical protein
VSDQVYFVLSGLCLGLALAVVGAIVGYLLRLQLEDRPPGPPEPPRPDDEPPLERWARSVAVPGPEDAQDARGARSGSPAAPFGKRLPWRP